MKNRQHPKKAFLSLVAAALLISPALCAPAASPTDSLPAHLDISANPSIVVFKDAQTPLVTLTATPSHFTPASYHWAQVADAINPLSSTGKATFSNPNAAAPTVTFSTYGVYQLQLTATDGVSSVTKSAWVHVWDSTPALGAGPGKLGFNPGLTPPTSVRQLSSDPGPFQHPRVLFTNADWPEMSQRAIHGRVAAGAISQIRSSVTATLDNPYPYNASDPKTKGSPIAALAQALDAYAQGTGPAPDVTLLGAYSTPLNAGDGGQFYGALMAACYLAWIGQDPAVDHALAPAATQQRFQYLARITAAAAQLHFAQIWNRQTGTFNTTSALYIGGINVPGGQIKSYPVDLGVSYELVYSWMTPTEQVATRDFLYALCYGRHTAGNFYGSGPDIGKPVDGPEQNGDFANEYDAAILGALTIEGEDSAVSADVRQAFGVPKTGAKEAQWCKPAASTNPSAWPGATQASVDNLQREIYWTNQWYVSPWGFVTDNLAYYALSAEWFFPSALALSRHGENQFVTTYIYNSIQHALYIDEPGEGIGSSPYSQTTLFPYDHHDSGTFEKGALGFLWKYMYPDDPAVDLVYNAWLPSEFQQGHFRDPFIAALFALDPGSNGQATSMTQVGQAKQLPLTKFDPQLSIAVARNGWDQNDANLFFDCGWYYQLGHMHAEKNSFSFYALGRAWSVPPGYHATISDLQAAVLIQNPAFAADPATHGYVGESPSSAIQEVQFNHPTPSGHILEVTESPDKVWSLFAGDASAAYRYAITNENGPQALDTGLPLPSLMYPGLYDSLISRIGMVHDSRITQDLHVSQDNYNTVRYAIRSILFVRGARPYALIVDDINKDGTPRNYKWTMNGAKVWDPSEDARFLNATGNYVYSSLAIQPNATPTEAVLYHSPIDDAKTQGQTGLPRLLVRDVTEQSASSQPPMVLESRPPGPGDSTYLIIQKNGGNPYSSGTPQYTASNRLLIERDGVVDPRFKVLLFPYRTGETPPVTTWNAAHTQLTIDLKNGTVDTITFMPNAQDNRTRMTFNRLTPAPVSAVSAVWGTQTAALATAADGLRLLPAGRTTDLPWNGITALTLTLSAPAALTAADVSVTGVSHANYGPVTVSGSGTTYTVTLATPLTAADRVTLSVGNAAIPAFTRLLPALPGDISDDGSVSASDTVLARNALGSQSVFADINGDGNVSIADYILVRQRLGTHLP